MTAQKQAPNLLESKAQFAKQRFEELSRLERSEQDLEHLSIEEGIKFDRISPMRIYRPEEDVKYVAGNIGDVLRVFPDGFEALVNISGEIAFAKLIVAYGENPVTASYSWNFR